MKAKPTEFVLDPQDKGPDKGETNIQAAKRLQETLDMVKRERVITQPMRETIANLESSIASLLSSKTADEHWSNMDREIKMSVTDARGNKFHLMRIDSTHFYISNEPGKLGQPYHIGQIKGEPYYDQVDAWLQSRLKKSNNKKATAC